MCMIELCFISFQDRDGWTTNSPVMARQTLFNNTTVTSSSTQDDTPSCTISPLPPLPPARRLDHPSRQLNIPSVTSEETEETESQSHSAPSSPTHAPKPPPRPTHFVRDDLRNTGGGSSRGGGSPRPLSMVVPSMLTGMENAGKYADLHFEPKAETRPVPKPRGGAKGNTINYSVVRPDKGVARITMAGTDEVSPPTLAIQDRTSPTSNPPLPPRSVDEVPPPPPPSFGDTDVPPLPPKDLFDSLPPSITDSFIEADGLTNLDSSQIANFDLDFPNFEDEVPWASTMGGATSKPKTAPLEIQREEGHDSTPIYGNELTTDTADMTGSSAYEDAGEIIRAAIERRSLKDKDRRKVGGEMDEHGYHNIQLQQQIRTDNNGSPVFDLPDDENLEPLQVTNVDDNSPDESPYAFPHALQRHPLDPVKPATDSGTSDPQVPSLPPRHDEPHMELLTFVKKPSPAVERKNLELPPLPERNPPVPVPVSRSRSVEPPAPRSRHFVSPPPSQTSHKQEPPLPPRNPPKPSNGPPPTATSEPPLPPRNPMRVSSSPGPPPQGQNPPRLTGREAVVSDLVNDGYSRSDVVKALAIAQNNVELAKMILSGFGVKN